MSVDADNDVIDDYFLHSSSLEKYLNAQNRLSVTTIGKVWGTADNPKYLHKIENEVDDPNAIPGDPLFAITERPTWRSETPVVNMVLIDILECSVTAVWQNSSNTVSLRNPKSHIHSTDTDLVSSSIFQVYCSNFKPFSDGSRGVTYYYWKQVCALNNGKLTLLDNPSASCEVDMNLGYISINSPRFDKNIVGKIDRDELARCIRENKCFDPRFKIKWSLEELSSDWSTFCD